MTISLPPGLLDKYYEACDFFLDNDIIGISARLVYPPKRVACNNCVVRPVGGGSTNVYINGGPAPFQFGLCPLCGGNGYKETDESENIRLRAYWNKADWIKVGSSINIADASVMVIGYLVDLPKVLNATEIVLAKDNMVLNYRTVLLGQPYPHGFGHNKYFMAFLKGA